MSAPRRRTIVKICGLTRGEDARHAFACGADWLGFVLKADSPRRIDATLAGAIIAALPPDATTVAVMVAPDPDEALALARQAGTTRVQLHRVDPASWPASFPLPASFAVPIDVHGAALAPVPPTPHLVHLDTAVNGREWGTGVAFPWAAAEALARTRPVMLAGGLAADNVAAAIAAVRPFGVDASSRLESSPGVKDSEQVRRFIVAAREADVHARDR